jgi:hypothetical protein
MVASIVNDPYFKEFNKQLNIFQKKALGVNEAQLLSILTFYSSKDYALYEGDLNVIDMV